MDDKTHIKIGVFTDNKSCLGRTQQVFKFIYFLIFSMSVSFHVLHYILQFSLNESNLFLK